MGPRLDTHDVALGLSEVFVEKYYRIFDGNPADVINFYDESAVLIVNGEQIRGRANVLEKLLSLLWKERRHSIETVDSQGCYLLNGIFLQVGGNFDSVSLDGEAQSQHFYEAFLLTPDPVQGGYSICNHVVRVVHLPAPVLEISVD